MPYTDCLPPQARIVQQLVIRDTTWHTAVIVPARNEAERIGACLESLRCQWSLEGRSLLGEFVTLVIVNGSTDATTREVVRWHSAHPHFPLLLVDVDFPSELAHVGSARGLGFDLAVALLRDHGRGRRLLFSTDADTRLNPTALAEAYQWLERGANAVGAFIRTGEPDTSQIGAVVNAYRHLSAKLRQYYYPCPFTADVPHGDFGGAGFGISYQAYSRTDGLPRASFDEDQGMRKRLLDSGAKIVYPRSLQVFTSTRHDGRTPWGMAQQLQAWESDYAAKRWPMAPTAAGIVWKYALKSSLREGRPPINFFDRSGELKRVWDQLSPKLPFEARWRQFWGHPTTVTLREQRFPQCSLPEAYASLVRARLPIIEKYTLQREMAA